MKTQFDFINKVNMTVDKAHKAISSIRSICEKLTDFEKNYSSNLKVETLIKESKKLREELYSIEEALYQTKNRSSQDPLNFPIRLTNKLGYLNDLVSSGDFPPTYQDELVRKELTIKIENHLDNYTKLIKSDLVNFNKLFAELNLDYLIIK